jgi:hypothetical protein
MIKILLTFNGKPVIFYKRDAFGERIRIEDATEEWPEHNFEFQLTPIQLFKFGLKCLWAAIGG